MLIVGLNNIVQRIFKPIACQNVISDNPNNSGINQFHNSITGYPRITITIAISPKKVAIDSIVLFIRLIFYFVYI